MQDELVRQFVRGVRERVLVSRTLARITKSLLLELGEASWRARRLSNDEEVKTK